MHRPDARRRVRPLDVQVAPPRAVLAWMVAALAVVALPNGRARAADWSGSTTTIWRAFDIVNGAHERSIGLEPSRSYRPLDQYLHLSVARFGKRQAWTFDGQVRGRLDTASGRTGQSDLEVMTASAGWRSKGNLLDLRLGRQTSVVGLGWHSYDGLRLDFDKAPHVKVFLYGGLPTSWGYARAPQGGSWTAASGFTLVAARHGTFGMDYEKVRRGGSTESETAGTEFSFGAKAWRLSGYGDYSFVVNRYGDSSLSYEDVVRSHHAIELRVTRVQPVFPADEIWNVFPVNPYEEYRASYDYRGESKVRFGGYVAVTHYFPDAFPGPQDEKAAAVTASIAGSKHRKHRAELGWQEGFASKRLAARWDTDWDLTAAWRLGLGASAGSYENAYRLGARDERESVRSRLQYDHFGRWNVAFEVEEYFGRDGDTVRGTLIVGTKLGHARRERPWWGGRWGDAWDGGRGPRDEAGAAAKGGAQ